MKKLSTLQFLLYAGALYFALITLAHFSQFKVPGLFIYYNVPSYAYQDKVIGFLAFGWACMFFMAARHFVLVKSVILCGVAALAGLAFINLTTPFSQLSSTIQPVFFWLQTGLLGVYIGWLSVLYRLQKKSIEQT